jgi:hypothetical protein
MESDSENREDVRIDASQRWRRGSYAVLSIFIIAYLYSILSQYKTIFADLLLIIVGFCSIFVFVVYFTVTLLGKLLWKKFFDARSLIIILFNLSFVVSLLFLLPYSREIKFFVLKNAYFQMQSDISRDYLNGKIEFYQKTDVPLANIKIKRDYLFFPKDSDDVSTVSLAIDGENQLIFFMNSSFIFDVCGIMYSSEDVIPDMSFFDFGWGSRGGFVRLEKNWFHGCIRYD